MGYIDNEKMVKELFNLYGHKVFAFILYLVGLDQDWAYDICADSFVEAIGMNLSPNESFLTKLISIAISKARITKIMPEFGGLDFLQVSEADKGALRIVLEAFCKLDFETKVILLLRDQMNLGYEKISNIMHKSEVDVKTKLVQARLLLRKEIENIFNSKTR
ncbi:MAG: hypothetical protein NC908_00775 [Candidatus Omnitrophica bacterium]|nr:hypothetical protein [Candidatus Omnitrophota bacterium]